MRILAVLCVFLAGCLPAQQPELEEYTPCEKNRFNVSDLSNYTSENITVIRNEKTTRVIAEASHPDRSMRVIVEFENRVGNRSTDGTNYIIATKRLWQQPEITRQLRGGIAVESFGKEVRVRFNGESVDYKINLTRGCIWKVD